MPIAMETLVDEFIIELRSSLAAVQIATPLDVSLWRIDGEFVRRLPFVEQCVRAVLNERATVLAEVGHQSAIEIYRGDVRSLCVFIRAHHLDAANLLTLFVYHERPMLGMNVADVEMVQTDGLRPS